MHASIADAGPMVEKSMPENFTISKPATEMPVPFDDVSVPYEILMYAQVAYQGYAVTDAIKISWAGQEAYQLRIDNDSDPNDSNGMYLIYGMEWKLITERALYQAPAARPTIEPEQVNKPQPQEQVEDENETVESASDKPQVTAADADENSQPTEEKPERPSTTETSGGDTTAEETQTNTDSAPESNTQTNVKPTTN